MKTSVIQDLRNLADRIEVSINNSQTTSVGCCTWLFRLFCGPSATLAANTPLLGSDIKSDFIALANNLDESRSLKKNTGLINNFLQNYDQSSLTKQEDLQLRNQVAGALIFLKYFQGFRASDISWCTDTPSSPLLKGIKTLLTNSQFIYHQRARSFYEALHKSGLLNTPVNQNFIDYLTKLPKQDRPKSPLSRSFDSFLFEDDNFQHAQDLLRNLAASANHHEYFAIANGLLQNMIQIANDLSDEIDYQPGALLTLQLNPSY